MLEFKVFHVDTNQYYRFSDGIPKDADEYKLLVKKIISTCQLKNKCQFYYMDDEGDKITLRTYQDAETMFRLRLYGHPIRIFVDEKMI